MRGLAAGWCGGGKSSGERRDAIAIAVRLRARVMLVAAGCGGRTTPWMSALDNTTGI